MMVWALQQSDFVATVLCGEEKLMYSGVDTLRSRAVNAGIVRDPVKQRSSFSRAVQVRCCCQCIPAPGCFPH